MYLLRMDDLSDSEYFVSRVRLVIITRNNAVIDEDSEDENELVPKNLSRSQFLAGATADLSTSSDKILLGAGDEEEVAGLSVDVPSKSNTGLKVYAFL